MNNGFLSTVITLFTFEINLYGPAETNGLNLYPSAAISCGIFANEPADIVDPLASDITLEPAGVITCIGEGPNEAYVTS